VTSFSATRSPSSQDAAKTMLADVTIVMAGSSPLAPPQRVVSAIGGSTSGRLDVNDAARTRELTPARVPGLNKTFLPGITQPDLANDRRWRTHCKLQTENCKLQIPSPDPTALHGLVGRDQPSCHTNQLRPVFDQRHGQMGPLGECPGRSRVLKLTRVERGARGTGPVLVGYIRAGIREGGQGPGGPGRLPAQGSHRSVHAHIRAYGSSSNPFTSPRPKEPPRVVSTKCLTNLCSSAVLGDLGRVFGGLFSVSGT